MLLQLAQAGPGSYPQVHALAQAGPKALKGIINTEAAIDRIASGVGGYIAGVETGGTIRQHRVEIRRDDRQIRHEARLLGEAVAEALHGKQLDLVVTERAGRLIARLVKSGDKQNTNSRGASK
jgi:hypothetical protein